MACAGICRRQETLGTRQDLRKCQEPFSDFDKPSSRRGEAQGELKVCAGMFRRQETLESRNKAVLQRMSRATNVLMCSLHIL